MKLTGGTLTRRTLIHGPPLAVLAEPRRRRQRRDELREARVHAYEKRVSAWFLGADDGDRTRDPQLGKLMLYQLSYVRANPDSSRVRKSDFRPRRRLARSRHAARCGRPELFLVCCAAACSLRRQAAPPSPYCRGGNPLAGVYHPQRLHVKSRCRARDRHGPPGQVRGVRRRRPHRPAPRSALREAPLGRQRPHRRQPGRRDHPAGPRARRRPAGRLAHRGGRPVDRRHRARLERDPSRLVDQRRRDRAGDADGAPGRPPAPPDRRR